MFKIGIVIQQSGVLSSTRATRKAQTRLMKIVLQAVLKFWHQKFIRKHFASPAKVKAEYPGVYEKRSKKYQMRKARMKGHTRLLVWSGATEEAVLVAPRTGGSSKRAWLRLWYPNKAKKNKAGKWSSVPLKNINAELTAINSNEEQQMADYAGRLLVRRMDKIRDRETIIVNAA